MFLEKGNKRKLFPQFHRIQTYIYYHSIQSGWIMLNTSSALLVAGGGNCKSAWGNRSRSVRVFVTGGVGQVALSK
jgi:hypothetical protein